MIVAAGLSPAWQQICVVDGFEPGNVNRASEAFWCGSGKVLNVGVALHHLSGGRPDQTLTISTIGGAAFESIKQELAELGVPRRWVRTASPTRICTTILDSKIGVATELVENAGPITEKELADFENVFTEAATGATAVVLTGSLPTGTPPTFVRQLLQYVHCPAVLDIRGPELLAALEARPLVVKPNREELGRTLGEQIASDSELRQAIGELQRRGAQAVVVTSGRSKVWLGFEGQFLQFQPRAVDRVVNPIGCGDCLAAGMAWALGHGSDMAGAVDQGMALAAENLRTALPCDFDGRRERIARR